MDSGAHVLPLGTFAGAAPSAPSSAPSSPDSAPDSSELGTAATSSHVAAHDAETTRGRDARLTGIVRQHYAFVWRSLRRLGVPEADADDAAQRVLEVIARRLADIEPRAEKSFLFQTALRVASDLRRSRGRARTIADEDTLTRATDDKPSPEEALDRKQARAELDMILDQLSLDLRAVFVLFELEEMSTNEIAALLSIPPGTVSSRLHRAREDFQAICARARAARSSGRRP